MRRSVRRRLLRRRIAKVLGVVVVLLALLAMVVAWVLPPIIRGRAERQLAAALNRPVTIGKLRINPFRFSAEVSDFSVGDRGNPAPLLTLRDRLLEHDRAKAGRAFVAVLRLLLTYLSEIVAESVSQALICGTLDPAAIALLVRRRATPRRPTKVYRPWPLENVPGVGGHLTCSIGS